MRLILASSSPRRREILGLVGAKFDVIVSEAEESVPSGCSPEDAVCLLAGRKAGAVLVSHPELAADCCIVGADTVVDIDGRILGKPKDRADAFSMLSALSGRMHLVHTGICAVMNEKSVAETVTTRVYFDTLTESAINRYLDSGEPFDKAGAYAVQGRGALFVRGISGDFFNVMGLPARSLNRMISSAFGLSLRDFG